ncbi:hypothetical protein JRO89_XS04G0045500 [Xanthoceras sorbifolium]|uniref:Retrovirus-related Pol polyprotein from transposon TNT 1-94-like beta-barrel domain-containing protein n=1 Tax=Xanthoceras sorbifolium TaxID=99658 RepID=A0ABQ8I4N8_9ROSI|nr:hypothetical protein JRO89_XS04G0045500 [Xanthoceras sorbifolium]
MSDDVKFAQPDLVETGCVRPAATVLTEESQTSYEALQLKDLKVKNYLFQAIDRSIMETILKKDTAKDIWDTMKKKYEGNTRVKRSTLQGLCRDFETLEMKSGETITVYFLELWQWQIRCSCMRPEEKILGFLTQGAPITCVGDQAMFSRLDESFKHSVKLGNNTKMKVTGKGDVKLLINSVNHIITEVYYVPELKNNLLSIGHLQVRGLAILIEGGSKKMVRGLPNFTTLDELCEDCIVGKHHRDPIPRKSYWRAGEIGSGDRRNESPTNGDSEDSEGSIGKRVRNHPEWMRDYVSGEDLGLFEDESCKLSKNEDGVAINKSYYKQIVGSLMYLTATRPDIMYTMSLISRFMAKPTEIALQAAKRILRKKASGSADVFKNGGPLSVKGHQVHISVEAVNEYYELENVNHTGEHTDNPTLTLYNEDLVRDLRMSGKGTWLSSRAVMKSEELQLDSTFWYNVLTSERHVTELLPYDIQNNHRVRCRIDDDAVEGGGPEPMVNNVIEIPWRATVTKCVDMQVDAFWGG